MIDDKLIVDTAKKYLEEIYGKGTDFREGQLDAIVAAVKAERVLVVQKTGWGKSLIYFLTTRILRGMGKGPTIVISPLLALMNNQIESAGKFGLIAKAINSNNIDEWDNVIKEVQEERIDVLFISPERLSKEDFNRNVLDKIIGSIGMFVIDEAHCISDWGHDFRPDYRRIVDIVNRLPKEVALIATTATANDRVIDDIANQLGDNILIQRGSLIRESIAIEVKFLNRKEERLAWISENINNMNGTGIIYCLTKSDCNLVTKWLEKCGVSAYAYYSGIGQNPKEDSEERAKLENMFLENKMKVLVATTAFGMGIDKPDIGFVIHFQKPGNVISYYQQIGRAGRAVENADAILLVGNEDDTITNHFINSAFPTYDEMDIVIKSLEESGGLSVNQLMEKLNISKTRIDKSLKFLDITGDVYKEKTKYYKSDKTWQPDMEYSDKITKTRQMELERMNDYINTENCYMEFIAKELSDKSARGCGKCSNCRGENLYSTEVKRENIVEAIEFIKKDHARFEPRKKWPSPLKLEGKNAIAETYRCEEGIALSNFADAGWGQEVKIGKYKEGKFSEDIVEASVKLLKDYVDKNNIQWVTSVPSIRRPELVRGFAKELSLKLNIPYEESIIKVKDTKEQLNFNNSYSQCINALDGFEVEGTLSGNVLLVDDVVDTRWTFAVCSFKLIQKGSGKVYPFVLSIGAGE